MIAALNKIEDPRRVRTACDMTGASGLAIGAIGGTAFLSRGSITSPLQVQVILVLVLATVIGFRCAFCCRSDYRRENFLLSLALGVAAVSTLSQLIQGAHESLSVGAAVLGATAAIVLVSQLIDAVVHRNVSDRGPRLRPVKVAQRAFLCVVGGLNFFGLFVPFLTFPTAMSGISPFVFVIVVMAKCTLCMVLIYKISKAPVKA